MTNKQPAAPTWEDVRRIADELELKIHLGGMEARDRWRELKPRVVELETSIARAGKRVGGTVADQIASLVAAMRKLRDDMTGEPNPQNVKQ